MKSSRETHILAKAMNHVGHLKWDIIATQNIEDTELWRVLYKLGKTSLKNNDNDFVRKNRMCCGDKIYNELRYNLINNGLIYGEKKSNIRTNKTIDTKQKKPKQKNKTKPMNKSQIIIYKNNLSNAKKDLDKIFSQNIITKTFNDDFKFDAKFEEFIIVQMMVRCKNMIARYKYLVNKKRKLDRCTTDYKSAIDSVELKLIYMKSRLLELIIGFLKLKEEKSKISDISLICVDDLNAWIDYSKSVIAYDPHEVIIKNPEIIFRTKYDKFLEAAEINLYDSQIDIYKLITSDKSYLALVHTMLGSGKTSMVLPICGWLSTNQRGKQIKSKILFCCPNEIVLIEVAHMVYSIGISFAIVVRNNETGELEYKWSSFADKNSPNDSCILYICDMIVASILLTKRAEKYKAYEKFMYFNSVDPSNYPISQAPHVPNYIFIGDELTKDADSQNGFMTDNKYSLTTELFINLMKLIPPKSIIMSATLPTFEQMPLFFRSIADKNIDCEIRSFSSTEAKIGCALISANGELFTPHNYCKTISNVRNILDIIQNNPFIGRFYTFEIVVNMIEILKKNNLVVPDLSVMVENPGEVTQYNIQKTAYSMLETLIQSDDDNIVAATCGMIQGIKKPINMHNILTHDSHRFGKNTLIFCTNPDDYALDIYINNFGTNTNDNLYSQIKINSILVKYAKNMKIWETKIDNILKKKEAGISKQNKNDNKKEGLDMSAQQKASNFDDHRPMWDFPQVLQIGSIAHSKKYNIPNHQGSVCITPDDLPENSCVSDKILILLASGIGIYSTLSKNLDDVYLRSVLHLAKKGLLRFIFTDSSIAYGTNLAVSDIIIVDQIYENLSKSFPSIDDIHSMKTIFQMFGRAGRGGNLSYEAKIYTTSPENKLISKLNEYCMGTLDEGTKDEIKNISVAFDSIWN